MLTLSREIWMVYIVIGCRIFGNGLLPAASWNMLEIKYFLIHDENSYLFHFHVLHYVEAWFCLRHMPLFIYFFPYAQNKVTFFSQTSHLPIKLICLHANFVTFTSLTIYHGIKKFIFMKEKPAAWWSGN